MEMDIYIEAKEVATTKKGKHYTKVDADKGEFFVWNPTIAERLQEGKSYRVIVEGDEFPQIKSVIDETVKEMAVTGQVNGMGAQKPKADKESMYRCNAMNNAALIMSQYAKDYHELGPLKGDSAKLADFFYKWLNGTLEVIE